MNYFIGAYPVNVVDAITGKWETGGTIGVQLELVNNARHPVGNLFQPAQGLLILCSSPIDRLFQVSIQFNNFQFLLSAFGNINHSYKALPHTFGDNTRKMDIHRLVAGSCQGYFAGFLCVVFK